MNITEAVADAAEVISIGSQIATQVWQAIPGAKVTDITSDDAGNVILRVRSLVGYERSTMMALEVMALRDDPYTIDLCWAGRNIWLRVRPR